jgi:thiosulfate reductase cytochrome b subunit
MVTASFVALTISGVVILMAHPRLYWGESGNDLTQAWLELPISKNHRQGGWTGTVPFFEQANSPVSAVRTFEIFNQNGWARSLHFLAAWLLVAPGLVYFLVGFGTGHFRRNLKPRKGELSRSRFREEVRDHLRLRIHPASGGPEYGLLQKCAYVGVVFLLAPLAVLSGLAMSPMITADYPILSNIFGGLQSARSVHFFAFCLLLLFLVVHVTMVIKSGFKLQMAGMTIGK